MKVNINEVGLLVVIAENKEENISLMKWFKDSEIPLYDNFPIICYVRNTKGFLDQIL